MNIPEPSQLLIYFDPVTGRLTPEGMKFFRQLSLTLKDHEARIAALEP